MSQHALSRERTPRILTPDQGLRVFVSSTLDLTEQRAAAKRAIQSLHLIPVMYETAARPHPRRALYRAYLEHSDVLVAIYSTRYGWSAPGMNVSGLEDEFHLSQRMPRLVYIQAGVERESGMQAFLERVPEAGLSYKQFASPDELQALVAEDRAAFAQYRMARGDDEGLHDLLDASLEHLASSRHIGSTILTLEVIAKVGLDAGHAREAVSLLGATAAIRSAMGPPSRRWRPRAWRDSSSAGGTLWARPSSKPGKAARRWVSWKRRSGGGTCWPSCCSRCR